MTRKLHRTFLSQLTQRKVTRVALAYIVIGWLAMQVGEEWIKTSIRNEPMDSIIRYNAACFYALKGDTEKALDCLESCLVKVGQVNSEWLEHDSNLDSIRDHPRYPGIIASITDNATDPVK